MSNEFFELCLVRTEGFDIRKSSLGCYVSVQGHLRDVITPLTQENQDNGVQLHQSNILRLIVKNMGDSNQVLGSITFPSYILPKQGFQWLPLFSDLSNDYIQNLPHPLQLPKILVLVKNKAELSPIVQITQGSDLESQMQQRALFDYDSRSCSDLPTPKSVKSGSKTTLQTQKPYLQILMGCLQEQKSLSKKFEELYKEALAEGEQTKKSLQYQKKQRQTQFNQIQKLTKEYNQTIEVISKREESLNFLLEDRDQEILQLKSLEIQHQKKIRELQKQNSDLLHLNNTLKHQMHGGTLNVEKQEVKTRCKNRYQTVFRPRGKRRSVDACIAQFSKRICKPNLFRKLQDNIYLVDKKKVYVVQKNGQLLCRVGGGFETIQSYVQGTENNTPRKGHRRYNTFQENIPTAIETEPSEIIVTEQRRMVSPIGSISRTPLANRNKQQTKRLPFR